MENRAKFVPVHFCSTTTCSALLLSLILSVYSNAYASDFPGIVVDGEGEPIVNALVRVQGTDSAALTDRNGNFVLSSDGGEKLKNITAWKSGYFNGGQPLLTGNGFYRVELKSIHKTDNKDYKWIPSLNSGDYLTDENEAVEKACEKCHQEIVKEWLASTHSSSATNQLFLTFFNGTGEKGQKAVAPGYKIDFPNSNGNCAACHVPAMALNNPFNSDPNKATGVEKQGVFCDLCHKIENVKLDKTGGYPGILSIKFNRPTDGRQIFYGPYDDVFPGDDSCNLLYKNSNYCAPCHNGRFWDVLVYSEFQEWADSDYAKNNIHCQDCHMKSSVKMSLFASEDKGGIYRNPVAVPSHINFGVADNVFMSEAINLNTSAVIEHNILNITATVKNLKAGHHYPTGNPMRNMILLIEAFDENGRLQMIEGGLIPEWGGIGARESDNYAGLPGKGFAKVLRDVSPYPADSQKLRHFRPEYPAPQWRPVTVESDNRIPANGSDVSSYQFRLEKGSTGLVYITTRLIYRRAYRKWLEEKGIELPDMEIALHSIVVNRGNYR